MGDGFCLGFNVSPGSMVWVSRLEEQRVESIVNSETLGGANAEVQTVAPAIYNLSRHERHTEVSAPGLSLAASWKPIERLLLTAQTDLYLGSQYTYKGFSPDTGIAKKRSGFEVYAPLEKTYTIKKNDVVDFAGGLEFEVLKGYSVACGGFTDFSQGPDDDRPASWDRNIDYYGVTLSLGMDKDLTQSRFGFAFAYGDANITHFQWTQIAGGRYIVQPDPDHPGQPYRPRQNFDAYNLGVFLSSTLKI
jgi:hypothetical protein